MPMPAPTPLDAMTAHERVRKLLLNHLRVIERAAQDQSDEALRQACADFAQLITRLPAEPALHSGSP